MLYIIDPKMQNWLRGRGRTSGYEVQLSLERLPWTCSGEASVSTVACWDRDYVLKQKDVVLGENVEKLVVTVFSPYTFFGCFGMFWKLTQGGKGLWWAPQGMAGQRGHIHTE